MPENQRQQGQDTPGQGGQGTGKRDDQRQNPDQQDPTDARNRDEQDDRVKQDQKQKQDHGNQGGSQRQH